MRTYGASPCPYKRCLTSVGDSPGASGTLSSRGVHVSARPRAEALHSRDVARERPIHAIFLLMPTLSHVHAVAWGLGHLPSLQGSRTARDPRARRGALARCGVLARRFSIFVYHSLNISAVRVLYTHASEIRGSWLVARGPVGPWARGPVGRTKRTSANIF